MNVTTLIGNLGREPEVRYLNSGSIVAKFSIAVRRSYQKEGQPESDWFDCEVWGKVAEVVANYVKKGHKVCVSGAIEFEYWEDKQTGMKRSKPIIKVKDLELLTPKDSQQPPAYAPQEQQPPQPVAQPQYQQQPPQYAQQPPAYAPQQPPQPQYQQAPPQQAAVPTDAF